MERDCTILREVHRWRFCLGRHLIVLCCFTGARATDRRLKILTDAEYLVRQKVLYGVPSVYSLTHKGKVLIQANKRIEKIRIERIPHDIAVLDTVCYFIKHKDIQPCNITSEKELQSSEGFGNKSHKPDFIFVKNGKKYAVEIELTTKSKDRLEKNVKANYLAFDRQLWIVPKAQTKIIKNLEDLINSYGNIKIIYFEVITSA